jgi:anti-sigma B factor antagonist
MTLAEPVREPASLQKSFGLEVEQVGPATVARIRRSVLLDQKMIDTLGSYMLSLVIDGQCSRLVLNLGSVTRMSSAMLGKIIAVQKRLQNMGGRLVLCQILPGVADILKTLHLLDFFAICGKEEEAVHSLE